MAGIRTTESGFSGCSAVEIDTYYILAEEVETLGKVPHGTRVYIMDWNVLTDEQKNALEAKGITSVLSMRDNKHNRWLPQ